MPTLTRSTRWILLMIAASFLLGAKSKDDDDDESTKRLKMSVQAAPAAGMSSYDFSAGEALGELGVTPGGSQDISYARDRVEAGEVPHSNTFTPEGLFSQYDLPMSQQNRCKELICVDGQATKVELLAQSDVRYLAQLGFRSSIKESTFKRPPLNLIAVVDTSCSMGGDPIETVRSSLEEVSKLLDANDRLSIVRYSEVVETVLENVRGDRKEQLQAGIARLRTGGSTYMEAGLTLGFELARQIEFEGLTRVMLFTDERPNVGRTDAESFMGMARAASKDGIGMTTVGVATHFGAELATSVSSVRGGNLVFFSNTSEMGERFAEDFDTLVTELAYDMNMEVTPAEGLRIAGIYGIPGEALEWTDDGGIRLTVETLFLSKRKGAIYVAFATDDSQALPVHRAARGSDVGQASLSYTLVDGRRVGNAVNFPLVSRQQASLGLTRGAMLVDEVTTLKEATRLHHEANDQEGAYQLVHALLGELRAQGDAALEPELQMVTELEETLARLSGHFGEGEAVSMNPIHSVTGLPLR